MSKSFGRHLRDLRKKHSKYSQQEMADMLNISRSTYTYYETGKSEPGQEKLKKICRILDVDFNTLLGYTDEKMAALVASGDNKGDSLNSLTPTEEQIILAYRSMNSEEKEFIGKQITKIVKS
ncbi:MAG: helix-turn-helix transcriptional regulator [Ruminococcus sp.]|jgi:transcriptional regulator with XRE-family HTH domain|nr:helix-turn-helix transcriptional regulator [Ruminococcus sp.]